MMFLVTMLFRPRCRISAWVMAGDTAASFGFQAFRRSDERAVLLLSMASCVQFLSVRGQQVEVGEVHPEPRRQKESVREGDVGDEPEAEG